MPLVGVDVTPEGSSSSKTKTFTLSFEPSEKLSPSVAAIVTSAHSAAIAQGREPLGLEFVLKIFDVDKGVDEDSQFLDESTIYYLLVILSYCLVYCVVFGRQARSTGSDSPSTYLVNNTPQQEDTTYRHTKHQTISASVLVLAYQLRKSISISISISINQVEDQKIRSIANSTSISYQLLASYQLLVLCIIRQKQVLVDYLANF